MGASRLGREPGGPSPWAPRGVQEWMAQSTKQSLYFPGDMLQQIKQEAVRQDRSMSWIVQHAWRAAREQLAKMPGIAELKSLSSV